MPVILLCHCDGTNGSTTFTDVSPSAHTLGAVSTTVNTTSPKFGTGAADFTSTSAALINTGNASHFNLGAAPFTLEAWAYFTSAPSGVQAVLAQFGASSDLGWFFGMVSGQLAFYYSTVGTDNPNVGAAYTPTLNTWIHLAVDRDASNVVRVYANGVVVASATVPAIYASTRQCLIGNDQNQNRAFPGRLDEVRVVTGTAMYGGAFTPPTGPFALNTTWSATDKSAGITLSGGNLIATNTNNAASGVRAADKQVTGKFYWEVTCTTYTWGGNGVGIVGASTVLGQNATSAAPACIVGQSGTIYRDGSSTSISLGTTTAGTLVCIALDCNTGRIWFRYGAAGNWNASAANNPATGVGGVAFTTLGKAFAIYPWIGLGNTNDVATANFGDTAFTGAVPSGFTSGFTAGASIPTSALATQLAVEHWATPPSPDARITQVALEQWASTAVSVQSDPPVGLLKLTGQAPTTTMLLESYPPVGAFRLAGFAPTLGVTLGSTVPVGALSFTGRVPAIVALPQSTIPVGAINFTGSVPSLISGDSLLVPKGSFSFAGSVPTPAPASSGQGMMVSVIV
jgi:hypothetical protein